MKKRKVLLFANTLWFINRFKSSLILDLIKRDYEVRVIYFRKGPIQDIKKIAIFSSPIKILNILNFIFDQVFRQKKKDNFNHILLSFTIGPILLSSLPLFRNYKRFATLEGLGRIFSSKNIFFILLRFFVKKYYKYIFHKNYDALFVLNYLDFSYLLENNLAPISKIFILPGTGVDSCIYNPENLFLERNKIGLINKKGEFVNNSSYITYMGRISAEKGFFRFLAAVLFLLNDNSKNYSKFRIVCPREDIIRMPNSLRSYLKKLGIEIKEYIDEPLYYYASSKLIVLPTTYGEGLSRVALESAFLGLPVAAIHNRGISSLFMDGMLGEVTMEQEPYGIARIIKKICENYSSYENHQKDVNSKIHKNLFDKYDNKSSTNKFISIMENLL